MTEHQDRFESWDDAELYSFQDFFGRRAEDILDLGQGPLGRGSRRTRGQWQWRVNDQGRTPGDPLEFSINFVNHNPASETRWTIQQPPASGQGIQRKWKARWAKFRVKILLKEKYSMVPIMGSSLPSMTKTHPSPSQETRTWPHWPLLRKVHSNDKARSSSSSLGYVKSRLKIREDMNSYDKLEGEEKVLPVILTKLKSALDSCTVSSVKDFSLLLGVYKVKKSIGRWPHQCIVISTWLLIFTKASQNFRSYLPHSWLNQNGQEHFW